MFRTPNEAIAFGLTASTKLFHRYIDDLKPGDFEYQPQSGVNCVAWIIGHLITVDRRTLIALGATNLPILPEGFEARFATTKAAAVKQSGFGEPSELLRLFDEHRAKFIAAVLSADIAKLEEPPSVPSPLYSNRGEAALFLSLHTAMHMGQVTIIRRSLGYPPIV